MKQKSQNQNIQCKDNLKQYRNYFKENSQLRYFKIELGIVQQQKCLNNLSQMQNKQIKIILKEIQNTKLILLNKILILSKSFPKRRQQQVTIIYM